MKLKYGFKESYQHPELDKGRLEWLVSKTNRSLNQTQFLYQLVDGDFEKLKRLEEQLSNCSCSYCPGDVECYEYVMILTPKSVSLNLREL